MEPDTGIQPYIFLCTEYEGEPNCVDGEMADPQFRTLEEIELLTPSLFQPFADDVKLLKAALRGERDPFEEDGGPGSGHTTVKPATDLKEEFTLQKNPSGAKTPDAN